MTSTKRDCLWTTSNYVSSLYLRFQLFDRSTVSANDGDHHSLSNNRYSFEFRYICLFVCSDALRPSKQLWSCRDVTSNFMGLLPGIEMK